MGKERKQRRKPAKFHPTDPNVGDQESPVPDSVLNIVDLLTSAASEERECGCTTIASFVGQCGAIPLLLQANVIKTMGPLMVDPSQSVRCAATGALRNLSVDGGESVCNEMVKEDVLTALTALLKQYEPKWVPDSPTAPQHKDLKSEIFLNAVHLLWNLCEFSEVAVKIVNQHDLFSLLISCISVEKYDYAISIAAAQCIYTASDSNEDAAKVLSSSSNMAILDEFIHQSKESTHYILLKALVTGIVYNVAVQQEATPSNGKIYAVVKVLSDTISHDISKYLDISVHALQEMQRENSEDTKSAVDVLNDEIKERKVPAADKALEDIDNIVAAQKLTLEMIANLCSTVFSEDQDWEDMDSSDGSMEDLTDIADEEMQQVDNSEMQSKLEIDIQEAVVQQGIIGKVISKCDMCMLEESVCDQLSSYSKGNKVLKGMETCSARAMLCLANLLSYFGDDAFGGRDMVRNVWLKLSKLLTHPKVVNTEDLLDGVSTALRSIARKLLEIDPTQFHNVTLSDLEVLFELGLKCNVDQLRVNAISVVSTIGTSLAKQSPPHPLLQNIGVFLLEVIGTDTQLWVITEALDAVLDVFADDHTNPVLQQLSLLEKLKEFAPILKQRGESYMKILEVLSYISVSNKDSAVRKEKRTLQEHLPVVSTVRSNILRFIQYKQKVMS